MKYGYDDLCSANCQSWIQSNNTALAFRTEWFTWDLARLLNYLVVKLGLHIVATIECANHSILQICAGNELKLDGRCLMKTSSQPTWPYCWWGSGAAIFCTNCFEMLIRKASSKTDNLHGQPDTYILSKLRI